MANLTTKILGLELKNPLIVGASNLVTDIDNLKRIENAGASAVVYKSLFEEQIQLERLQHYQDTVEYANRHAEMLSLFPEIEHAGTKEYLMNIEKAKKAINIPLIASLNGVYKESWLEYAKSIEQTGVDAIELNFYYIPRDFELNAEKIEKEQLEILISVKDAVKIPVSVKLSPFYTNTLNFINKLDNAGAGGYILFNSLFQPDIDIETEKHHYPYHLSNPTDNRLPLRYSGLLYGNVKGSIIANTGIFSGNDVIKMLLAGADAVQIVSVLYKNKIEHISEMLLEIESWMKSKNYNSIADFKGKLSAKNIKNPFTYKRAQYIDILMNSENIFKSYPMV